MRITCHILTILFCFSASSVMTAQSGLKHQNISSFVEYGASVHTGDNTPLWQVSNQHGLSSIDNNTYLRGGAFYTDTIRQWRLEGGLDMAVASGLHPLLYCNRLMLTYDINGWGYSLVVKKLTHLY